MKDLLINVKEEKQNFYQLYIVVLYDLCLKNKKYN